MTTFLMYLLVKLDTLSKMSLVVMLLCCVAFFILIMVYAELYNDDEKKKCQHFIMIAVKILISFTLLFTFLPTTKQAAFIWVAPQIIENGAVKDTVANIPELTKLGTEYLKQMLKDEINDNKNSTNAGENS